MFLFRIFRIKNFLLTVFALFICAVLALGFYVKRAVRFEDLEGERAFYLDSASSQGLMQGEISFLDFPRLRGESVRFPLETKTADETLRNIVEKYAATVLFTEEIDGTVSYYCYTAQWSDCVTVQGKKVNLHVALSTKQCVVGAPIIFGGF